MTGYLLFLFYYFITTEILGYLLYYVHKKYYKPIYLKKEQNAPRVNIHTLYPEFSMKDRLNYPRIFIGAFFLMPIRVILMTFFTVLLGKIVNSITQKGKIDQNDPKIRPRVEKAIKICTKLYLIAGGFFIRRKKFSEELVESTYKKYLGDDYFENLKSDNIKDDDYAAIISNHIGFFEIASYMLFYGAGFIAKMELSTLPFFGKTAKAINCLFINRENSISRKNILHEVEERMTSFYNKKARSPLVIFPEGTTSDGRHILKFKKGAFSTLLPLKPCIALIDKESEVSLAVGCTNIVFNWIRSTCYFYHYLDIYELPIIRPTEYMYEKYKHLGTEKWQIYAEASRRIYSEIGGLKMSNKGLLDSQRYLRALIKGEYEEDGYMSN